MVVTFVQAMLLYSKCYSKDSTKFNVLNNVKHVCVFNNPTQIVLLFNCLNDANVC